MPAADASSAPDRASSGLTMRLAEWVAAVGTPGNEVPEECLHIARQCVLDTLGCAVAAHQLPSASVEGLDNVELLKILEAELVAQAKQYDPAFGDTLLEGGASIWGGTTEGLKPMRLASLDATLLNGTAAHTLDFDDVEMMGPTHTSVALLPPLFALAETLPAPANSLPAVLVAFAAGFEVTSRLGALVSPDMYTGRGFHATGTLGAIGAAASCARLLGLDAAKTAHAMGLAGTQASGLKSLFGTHAKPFHAGKAGYHGLLSALLASRGFESRPDALECAQGFVASHSGDFNWAESLEGAAKDWFPGKGKAGGWHLRNNLFKYHASCYFTAAPIDAAVLAVRSLPNPLPAPIRTIRLKIAAHTSRVCNILNPRTGLEAKFSLRHALAAAALGRDTGRLATWTDAAVQADAEAARLVREGVEIDFLEGWDPTGNKAEVEVVLADGTVGKGKSDSGRPAKYVVAPGGEAEEGEPEPQGARIEKKFRGLAGALGEARMGKLVEMVYKGDPTVRQIVELTWL
ncbi:putative MmgE/Prp family protein [Hyaloraphidium curvatum]|nr:putative MmgE/Prp family protein [Hyaloraphidium curvatum]